MALHLRRGWRELCYASERDRWACDFIIPDAAIQVCLELTPANRGRELRGVIEGTRLRGQRRAVVVTLDQSDARQRGRMRPPLGGNRRWPPPRFIYGWRIWIGRRGLGRNWRRRWPPVVRECPLST